MSSLSRQVLIGVLVFVAQWLVLDRLTLWGAYPDAVLLFVAWMGLRNGRRAGAITGFTMGLLVDVIHDSWGIHMLVKTLVGFLVGLFPANERETLLILPQQALIGSFVIALLHNGILVLFLALEAGTRNSFMITTLWIGSAIYTTALGTLASLANTR